MLVCVEGKYVGGVCLSPWGCKYVGVMFEILRRGGGECVGAVIWVNRVNFFSNNTCFFLVKNQTAATKKILPKDVPGTLLNIVSFYRLSISNFSLNLDPKQSEMRDLTSGCLTCCHQAQIGLR